MQSSVRLKIIVKAVIARVLSGTLDFEKVRVFVSSLCAPMSSSCPAALWRGRCWPSLRKTKPWTYLQSRYVCRARASRVLPCVRVCDQLPATGTSMRVQGFLAALHFIITSSTRFAIDETVLSVELQQLGLPKANSNSISRSYRDAKATLRAALERDVLRVRTTQTCCGDRRLVSPAGAVVL